MSLRESLEGWQRSAPTLLQSTALGEPKLKRTAEDQAHRWSGVAETPPIESIEELAGRLRAALAADHLDQISDRDWTRAAFALWDGEAPLAAEPRFLDFYLARLEYYLAGPNRRRRRRDVSLLISAYLRAFAPDLPGIRHVAEILARFVPTLGVAVGRATSRASACSIPNEARRRWRKSASPTTSRHGCWPSSASRISMVRGWCWPRNCWR